MSSTSTIAASAFNVALLLLTVGCYAISAASVPYSGEATLQEEANRYRCLCSTLTPCSNITDLQKCRSCADAGLATCGLDLRSTFQLAACQPQLHKAIQKRLTVVAAASALSKGLGCVAQRLLDCGARAEAGDNGQSCHECAEKSFKTCNIDPLDGFYGTVCLKAAFNIKI